MTGHGGIHALPDIADVEAAMSKPPERCRFFAATWENILALGLFVALLIAIVAPNYVGHGRGRTNGIVNNLRQLDGAVQQWALDYHQTGAIVVAWKDIAPYLKGASDLHGWVKPVAGEVYVLKALPQSPEVVLTRELDGRPKGTVLRLGTNGDVEIILPKP